MSRFFVDYVWVKIQRYFYFNLAVLTRLVRQYWISPREPSSLQIRISVAKKLSKVRESREIYAT